MKSLANPAETNQPNYDAVDSSTIGKFVDSVQGLSPAEVKAYGIDVNNDVYIDKPTRQRPAAAQRSFQSGLSGYTTMGAETGSDRAPFGGGILRKSHVDRQKPKRKKV